MLTNLPTLDISREKIEAKHLSLIKIAQKWRLQEHTTKEVS